MLWDSHLSFQKKFLLKENRKEIELLIHQINLIFMDISKIERDLISIIKLKSIQAKVFLLIVIEGKMAAEKIGNKLGIPPNEALSVAKQLIELGSLIEISKNEFEAMHPRFTAVNMYRRMCEKEKIEFKRNVTVDNIGIALEKPYEDARTKYNKN